MELANTNLIKLYSLHLLHDNKSLSANDIYAMFKVSDITDVSFNLLAKTLHNMKNNGLVECENGMFKILEHGRKEYFASRCNLSSFLSLLEDGKLVECGAACPFPSALENIIAFKTVPYRVDFLLESELDFFKSLITPGCSYRFDGRGLGKSCYALAYKDDPYDYSDYVILFFNAGVVQYVGVIDEYLNDSKEIFFKAVVKLKRPITILDIRNAIRGDFNGSRQKQEIYLENEVEKMNDLLRTRLCEFGYDIYEK